MYIYFHFTFIPDCDIHAQKVVLALSNNHNIPKMSLKNI